jgi:hypothetical protein
MLPVFVLITTISELGHLPGGRASTFTGFYPAGFPAVTNHGTDALVLMNALFMKMFPRRPLGVRPLGELYFLMEVLISC